MAHVNQVGEPEVVSRGFRIPAPVLRGLKVIADRERRSVNGQIVVALEAYVAEHAADEERAA